MIIEVTQEGKRLDEIVFSHYGSLDYFDAVVEVNEELDGKVHLEVGDRVNLPEFESVEKIQTTKALWD